MADPVEVLEFWLSEVGPDGWFSGGAALDATCRDRFGEVWQAAHHGGLDHWCEGRTGTLAFVILTDQLSRNMHRDTALAFASDPHALAAAGKALAAGLDMQVPEPDRQFFYMPFVHSENPADQVCAVGFMADRMASQPGLLVHARAHQRVIELFGRFPTRNTILGRISTPAEDRYLAEGGYSAILRALKVSHADSA